MGVAANFIAPCGEGGDGQQGVRSCVDNSDFADDRSEVGVVSADGRGGIGKDDAKGFSAWLSREPQSLHRSWVRDRNVGAAVGDTVLVMTIYDYFVGVSVSSGDAAWVPDCFWLGSVEGRTPTLLFVVGVVDM